MSVGNKILTTVCACTINALEGNVKQAKKPQESVRSHVEYANSVWNPHRLGLFKDLEKVQMRATKLVITIKYLTYKDRLKRLKLPTLKYRHMRGDMIEVYKILTNKYNNNNNNNNRCTYNAHIVKQ